MGNGAAGLHLVENFSPDLKVKILLKWWERGRACGKGITLSGGKGVRGKSETWDSYQSRKVKNEGGVGTTEGR